TFICYLGGFAKHGESVCEAVRDKELQLILCRQLNHHIFAEGRGAFADIDSDVEYPALKDPDELCLCVWFQLVMKSADDAIAGTGLVILNKVDVQPLSAKRLFVI